MIDKKFSALIRAAADDGALYCIMPSSTKIVDGEHGPEVEQPKTVYPRLTTPRTLKHHEQFGTFVVMEEWLEQRPTSYHYFDLKVPRTSDHESNMLRYWASSVAMDQTLHMFAGLPMQDVDYSKLDEENPPAIASFHITKALFFSDTDAILGAQLWDIEFPNWR